MLIMATEKKKVGKRRYVVVLGSGPVEGSRFRGGEGANREESQRMFKAKRRVMKTLHTEVCLVYSKNNKEHHVAIAE